MDAFDDYQQEVGLWEEAFREYAGAVTGEQELLRVTGQLTARRMVVTYATNVASRGVNLANGVVLLLNKRHAHAAPAVARALFETCALAVYADRRLVPLLKKRRSPSRTDDVHRLLYRLTEGTHPGSETTHIKAIAVESAIKAMSADVDELMKDDPDTPPEWVGDGTYGEAIRRSYSILSEFTHPNSLATTLSQVSYAEWTLQPDITNTLMAAVLRPSWAALKLGRVALTNLVDAATDHPMEFTEPDPNFSAEEINPTTRIW